MTRPAARASGCPPRGPVCRRSGRSRGPARAAATRNRLRTKRSASATRAVRGPPRGCRPAPRRLCFRAPERDADDGADTVRNGREPPPARKSPLLRGRSLTSALQGIRRRRGIRAALRSDIGFGGPAEISQDPFVGSCPSRSRGPPGGSRGCGLSLSAPRPSRWRRLCRTPWHCSSPGDPTPGAAREGPRPRPARCRSAPRAVTGADPPDGDAAARGPVSHRRLWRATAWADPTAGTGARCPCGWSWRRSDRQ